MTPRYIFWAIPIVLFAAVAVVLYQISLQESNTLSMILEQELSEDPGETEELAESPALEKESVVEEEEEEGASIEKTELRHEIANHLPEDPKITKTESITPPSIEEETEPELLTADSELEVEKEVPVQISKVEEASIVTLVSQGALIETEEHLWNVITSANEESESARWHTILIQNEYKWDYTILPRDSRMWQIVQSGKELKIQLMTEREDRDDILSRNERGKYAVQILSVERQYFSRVLKILHDLVHDGYYAYMHRSKEKFKNNYWYRVRVGFFKTPEAAQRIGEEIYFRYRDIIDLPKNYWAVLPTQRELNLQLVDFQAQRNKPWFVELPLYDSQENAIEDLPELMDISDFAYLAYQNSKGKIQYRIRFGFFETQDEAQNKLVPLREIRKVLGEAILIKP